MSITNSESNIPLAGRQKIRQSWIAIKQWFSKGYLGPYWYRVPRAAERNEIEQLSQGFDGNTAGTIDKYRTEEINTNLYDRLPRASRALRVSGVVGLILGWLIVACALIIFVVRVPGLFGYDYESVSPGVNYLLWLVRFLLFTGLYLSVVAIVCPAVIPIISEQFPSDTPISREIRRSREGHFGGDS